MMVESLLNEDEMFYKEYLPILTESQKILAAKIEKAQRECAELLARNPVDHYKTRIKNASSTCKKLVKLDFQPTAQSAVANLHDIVGSRVVCGFISDVRIIRDWLFKQPDIAVTQEKDYIKHPKPNGYRSTHLIVRLPNGIFAEIQLRTLAMDCWAAMEHQMKYKKEYAGSELITRELKKCADEMASIDWNLLSIREILEKQH
jgi:putative GTP pyrophosphokinase